VIGVGEADAQGDGRAPVTALREVAVVAEAAHQLGPGPRDPPGVPARVARMRREPEPGDGRDDQVEGVARRTAVPDRVGQRLDHVEELGAGAGPAVGEQQRCRVRLGGAHVQEVHGRAVDLGGELRVPVEPGLVHTPVVAGSPVVGQFPQVADGHAPAPAGVRELAGPAGGGDPPVQVVQVVLCDVDVERVHHLPPRMWAAGSGAGGGASQRDLRSTRTTLSGVSSRVGGSMRPATRTKALPSPASCAAASCSRPT
jgi:hypothetical protein